MVGAMLCAPTFLASGTGSALQLQRALRLIRYIFISAACQANHTPILNLMMSGSRGEKKKRGEHKSRWQFFSQSTKKSFENRAAGRIEKHKAEMVTLVLPTEREHFAKYPGVQTLREFMRRIHKPDLRSSHMGYCKR